MEIQLKLEKEVYSIMVEPSCYTAFKHGINTNKGVNFGKPTQSALGYFTNISSAVKKIVQDSNSSKDEVVTLKAYSERVEKAYADLMSQVDL